MSVAAQPKRRLLSSDEVLRMLEAGILQPDEPLELIAGELYIMSPQGPRHRMLVVLVHKMLEGVYETIAHVQDHSQIRASAHSMPEPDVAVVRGDVRAYADRLPSGQDVILAVEVADTAVAEAHVKTEVYAQAGVAEYWIINLPERRLERHHRLAAGKYGRTELLGESETISPPGREDVVWQVSEMLA